MRIVIIIDAAVTNVRLDGGIRPLSASRIIRLVVDGGNSRDYSRFFSSMREKKEGGSTRRYGGYGLISVAIISRVSLYYTMAVTSAHAVINYDGSRNHYRGVSCNSGVLSVYIRL